MGGGALHSPQTPDKPLLWMGSVLKRRLVTYQYSVSEESTLSRSDTQTCSKGIGGKRDNHFHDFLLLISDLRTLCAFYVAISVCNFVLNLDYLAPTGILDFQAAQTALPC